MACSGSISQVLRKAITRLPKRRPERRQQLPELPPTPEPEVFLALERVVCGEITAEPDMPRQAPRPKVRARKDWARGTCWDLEDQIQERLMFIGVPGQFAACIPRDWEALMKRARTPEQRQLCRQGAATRARKELACRSRGWRGERRAFREIVRPIREDTLLDGFAAIQPANTGADSLPELELGQLRAMPPPGPPPARRVTRTRTQSMRRGGHGARPRSGTHARSIPTPA